MLAVRQRKCGPTRSEILTSMGADDSFSHLDEAGEASMVDVSKKAVTRRVAEASCRVLLDATTIDRLSNLPKGDALAVARIGGVQAAKRTGELIPLAHPLAPEDIQIEFSSGDGAVMIRSRVTVTARTGAEMEALTACSVAALTLYDMVKAVDKSAVITDLRLERKSGGSSGDFERADSALDDPRE